MDVFSCNAVNVHNHDAWLRSDINILLDHRLNHACIECHEEVQQVPLLDILPEVPQNTPYAHAHPRLLNETVFITMVY